MPELPEVETTCRGIAPLLEGQTIQQVTVRNRRLRWPIPAELEEQLTHQPIERVWRRAKYILLQAQAGTAIVHLGMSGSLCAVAPDAVIEKHAHVDLVLAEHTLRYRDPRRFGAWLWTDQPPLQHPLLAHLGPEPLTDTFHAAYLQQQLRHKTAPIKNLIMQSAIVVGVGNIYACESLFYAGILPSKAGGEIQRKQLEKLVTEIKAVLNRSIAQGGTTLKDFISGEGKPGYFQQTLAVYGRAGQPCLVCQTPIQRSVIGQRATYWCPVCQHG